MNNSFIPKNVDKDVISIRLNKSMIKELDVLSTKADVSRNELIRQMLEFCLERAAAEEKDEKK